MTKRTDKISVEMRIFRRFAAICALPLSTESAENRYPPEPDILCKVEGGSAIAFELVQIIDSGLAKRTDAQVDLHEHLENEYESFLPKEKVEISQRIGNALIDVAYKANVSLKIKRNTTKAIIFSLKDIDPYFEGNIILGRELSKVIKRITICRGDFNGPCFNVESVGSICDPIAEKLEEKFNKAYKTNLPIELLAYYDLQPILRESYWLPKAISFIERNIYTSPFERVWIFDVHKEKIIYSYSTNKISEA